MDFFEPDMQDGTWVRAFGIILQDDAARDAERVIGGQRVAFVKGAGMQGDFGVRLRC